MRRFLNVLLLPAASIRPATRLRMVPLLLAASLITSAPPPVAAQITDLPREDSTAGDFFGAAVAVHGDHILVGATGVDACGSNSGAAFIYERIPHSEGWRQAARLVPSDCDDEIFFGRSVDLSGRYAAVAASREFFSREAPNAVYVFERDSLSGAWNETARLTGGEASVEGAFATSVSIDGDRILVTTSGDPARGRFGGTAYIFERNRDTGIWERTERLTGSGGVQWGIFGTAGALEDGLAAVAASTYFRNRPGSVYIFEDSLGEWAESTRFGEVEDFFISVDVDSGRVLAGESKSMRGQSGSATLFERNADGEWKAAHVLRPDDPYDAGAFGSAVALEGDYALIVGYDEQLGLDFNIDRVVFVFKREPDGRAWKQYHVIDVGEVAFGADLDVYGRYAAIGSASDAKPGAVYVVRLPD